MARLTLFNAEGILGKYDIDLIYFPKIRGQPRGLSEFQKGLLLAKKMSFEIMKPIRADYQKLKTMYDDFFRSLEKWNEEQEETGQLIAKLRKDKKK